MMLIPRFSIRSLFALTAVGACIALVLREGFRGAVWAQSFGWTLVFLVVLFGLYFLLFLAAWFIASVAGIRAASKTPFAPSTAGENPFASSPTELPPS